MSLLTTLHARASYPASQLSEPAPTDAELEQILRCGMTAPDHAALRPWRFITIRDEARSKLGDLFVQVAAEKTPDIEESKKDIVRGKALRSPLIVVVVASITPDHPKAPEVEQLLSAGAATTLIQLGAQASGFGAVWLTGPYAVSSTVKKGLGVAEKDHIVGFLYMGTPTAELPKRKRPALSDHLTQWNG